MDIISANKPFSCLKLVWGLSTPLTILHRVYIAMCGFVLIILSPDWQEQLARQWLCACIPLFQFPSLLLLNSRFHGGALVRSGRMTMALIFKGVRLVNAFISMYTKESIISALLHSSNKLLHNFHTNLLFYSHYFWFFFFPRECFFVLCTRRAVGSEIRLELARIQCLAQRHFSRLGDRYSGPGAQLWCPATPSTDSWYEFQSVCVAWNIFILHFCSWIFLRVRT